jgi:hypothetical protein
MQSAFEAGAALRIVDASGFSSEIRKALAPHVESRASTSSLEDSSTSTTKSSHE